MRDATETIAQLQTQVHQREEQALTVHSEERQMAARVAEALGRSPLILLINLSFICIRDVADSFTYMSILQSYRKNHGTVGGDSQRK